MTVKVSLGIRLNIPNHHCLLLISRSLLAAEGVTVVGGLIDSSHKGTIHALLHNSNKCGRRITKGERVCQGLIVPLPRVRFIHGNLDTDYGTPGNQRGTTKEEKESRLEGNDDEQT